MQSLPLNLVENETPQTQKSETAQPVPSTPAKEVTNAGSRAGNPATPSEPMYAAFAWLFGPGCF